MASVQIEDFRAGLDRRKSIITAAPGTLVDGWNVHITRGGEIEKRLAFVPSQALPATSRGLASNSSSLFVFGPGPTPSFPPPYTYVTITHPTGRTLVRIVGVTMFRGLPYVLAAYDDGTVLHFYNGTIVPAWAPAGALAAFRATACCTLGSKVYVTADASLHFCQNDAPLLFATGVAGAGNIDLSTKYSGSEALTGVAVYIDRLAVYSATTTQVWVVDPDPLKNYLAQVLPNLGTLAGRSVVSYGDSDNFLLANTGVRNLRARDQTNTAGSYDIGTPIDDLVNPLVSSLSADAVTRATAVLEPVNSRFLLSIGTSVYVFSYFPSSKISAWTRYSVPAEIDSWAVIGRRLYARSGTQVFLYGGATGSEYDTCVAEVVLPYLDAKAPGTVKTFGGVDMAISGRWDLEIGFNPEPPYARELIGRFNKATFGMGRVGGSIGQGTHFSARLVSQDAAPATLSSFLMHFTMVDEKNQE